MRTIIAGSRNITDVSIVYNAIKESNFKIKKIISGGARGVDKIGEHYAKEYGLTLQIFNADWSLGKRAGILRNEEMAKNADALILVHNGSRGSLNMLERAKFHGLNIYVRKVEQFNNGGTIDFYKNLLKRKCIA